MHSRTQELLGFIDEQYAAFRAGAEAVPAHLRERQPGEGRWSVAQVVDHVSRVEGVVGHLVEGALAEARAQGIAPETETGSILDPADLDRLANREIKLNAPERAHPAPDARYDEAWAALEAAHARVRQVFADADGLALGSIQLPHPALGPLTLYQWGVAVGGHEARHAAQIRECAEVLGGAPAAA
jgi:hypothetical protein